MKLDGEISSASLVPRLILTEEMSLGTRLQVQLVYKSTYDYKFDHVINPVVL